MTTFAYGTQEEVIRAGGGFAYRAYWQSVRALAEEVLRQSPLDESAHPQLARGLVAHCDSMDEPLVVLRATDNADAFNADDFELDLGPVRFDEGVTRAYGLLAYYAMSADIQDELNQLRRKTPARRW